MKTLYLLRHAKSDWDDPTLSDHDRPLNLRGQRAAATMANYWAARKGGPPRPDLVLCSTARRAHDTLALVMSAWGDHPPAIQHERGLYLCGEGALLKLLKALAAEVGSVMLVAHNPDLQMLARDLCGKGDRERREQIADKLPTGTFVEIAVPDGIEWPDLTWGAAHLTAVVRPRDLS